MKEPCKYLKIKASCTDCPKRFYRTLLVKEDLNLKELGFLILTSLRAEFEHMYLFRDKKNVYEDATWVADRFSDNEFDYETVTINDIILFTDNTFNLEYDTGDGWEFKIKVYKDTKDCDINDAPAICLEGKGDRIWEDYRHLFWEFLETGDLSDTDEYPWNIEEGSTPKDFDNELDLQSINEDLESALYVMEEMDNF